MVAVWDVVCEGTCRHKSTEECVVATHLVFPYRGAYVQHVGRSEAVAEPNQMIFINEDEPYRVSHPIEGGDASLSIRLDTPTLLELASADYLKAKNRPAFKRTHLRLTPHVQALTALLRHRSSREGIETFEAEGLTLELLRLVLSGRNSRSVAGSVGRRKLVDRAKLVLASDLKRRWTLGAVAAEVGVSPVYLTQLFQQVEGLPLYRYQLQLRLARALDRLSDEADLTGLAFDLGFSSHSHFSAAFKRVYGQPPSAFQSSARIR
jgi:AraC-like DNA-binding protein